MAAATNVKPLKPETETDAEVKATILLVDDDELLRHSIGRVVRRAGFNLLLASDGEEALEILRNEHVDVIVADHYMPSMSGLQLLTVARLGWPNTVRILLTGHADQSVAIQAINRGEVYRLLQKPCDPAQLTFMLGYAVARAEQLGLAAAA